MEIINILDEYFGVPIGVLIVFYFITSIFLLVFIPFSAAIRSSSEKIKRKAIARFNIRERRLLNKIEAKPNEKEEIKQELTILRLEHESRMSDNLQKESGKFTADWSEVLLAARKRLLDEEQRLQVRNIINLATGMISVSVGAVLLGVFLVYNHDDKVRDYLTFIDFLILFGTRISIIIIIGIFAGFFLRLYSLTERAIANNKNEITNIELRLTSGLMLSEEKNKGKFAMLADTLSKEERNFVLKKNETSATADIDKVDIDRAVEIAIKAMKAGIS